MKKKTKPRKPRNVHDGSFRFEILEKKNLCFIYTDDFESKLLFFYSIKDFDTIKKLHKFLGQYIEWRKNKK